MFRRTLIYAAALLVFAAAMIVNLAILDLIPRQELLESLRKLIAVFAVSAVAIILIYRLYRLAAPPVASEDVRPLPTSPPTAKEEQPAEAPRDS